MECVTHAAIEAVWRVESARLLGGLVRLTRDVGLAEDLAQEALVVLAQMLVAAPGRKGRARGKRG